MDENNFSLKSVYLKKRVELLFKKNELKVTHFNKGIGTVKNKIYSKNINFYMRKD